MIFMAGELLLRPWGLMCKVSSPTFVAKARFGDLGSGFARLYQDDDLSGFSVVQENVGNGKAIESSLVGS